VKGRLITIEGGEGAGKSSVMAALRSAIAMRGVEVLQTREPGGTEVGEAIRAVLLDPVHRICADSELLLMFAARAQHLHELILPALNRGAWVVCDRFTDSSYAYQGAGRGMDTALIAELERWVVKLKPDLTLLLDVDTHVGRGRTSGREFWDRIERERSDFFERVRTNFLQRAALEPGRFRVIDASAAQEDVVRATIDALSRASSEWS
jgi:dTMP kinase